MIKTMPGQDQLSQVVRERFLRLNRDFVKRGASLADLKRACEKEMKIIRNNGSNYNDINRDRRYGDSPKKRSVFKLLVLILLLPILYSIVIEHYGLEYVIKHIEGTRCLVPNNYLVWEFTRPVSDCEFCRGVKSALLLENVTREQFAPYAYSSKPIVVKQAARHWMASKVFSLQFFRSLYELIDGAYESVDEEGQFLPFRGNFANLREVFGMSESRAMNLPGEEPWYVGWKNCHPQILQIMNKFYQPPHFLPEDAEIPNTNYIFLGYDQGANMHLDYISRLMWQGQIIGSKTWTVAPTPECDDVCEKFKFFVDTGDVVLLDTRIWYHGTQVENRRFSLTITSEYG